MVFKGRAFVVKRLRSTVLVQGPYFTDAKTELRESKRCIANQSQALAEPEWNFQSRLPFDRRNFPVQKSSFLTGGKGMTQEANKKNQLNRVWSC